MRKSRLTYHRRCPVAGDERNRTPGRVQDMNRRIPVIIVSWLHAIETVIDAMRHGAFDYIVKPYDTMDWPLASIGRCECLKFARRPPPMSLRPLESL